MKKYIIPSLLLASQITLAQVRPAHEVFRPHESRIDLHNSEVTKSKTITESVFSKVNEFNKRLTEKSKLSIISHAELYTLLKVLNEDFIPKEMNTKISDDLHRTLRDLNSASEELRNEARAKIELISLASYLTDRLVRSEGDLNQLYSERFELLEEILRYTGQRFDITYNELKHSFKSQESFLKLIQNEYYRKQVFANFSLPESLKTNENLNSNIDYFSSLGQWKNQGENHWQVRKVGKKAYTDLIYNINHKSNIFSLSLETIGTQHRIIQLRKIIAAALKIENKLKYGLVQTYIELKPSQLNIGNVVISQKSIDYFKEIDRLQKNDVAFQSGLEVPTSNDLEFIKRWFERNVKQDNKHTDITFSDLNITVRN